MPVEVTTILSCCLLRWQLEGQLSDVLFLGAEPYENRESELGRSLIARSSSHHSSDPQSLLHFLQRYAPLVSGYSAGKPVDRVELKRERVAQQACLGHSTHRCCCDLHVPVRSAVVKQPALAVPSHSCSPTARELLARKLVSLRTMPGGQGT